MQWVHFCHKEWGRDKLAAQWHTMSALTWVTSVRNGTLQEAKAVPAWVAAAARGHGPAPKSKATVKLDHLKALYENWLETAGCRRFTDTNQLQCGNCKLSKEKLQT